jgi:hypothetical protein
MLNAVEPGTEITIHRHPEKDETVVRHEEKGILELPGENKH